MLVAHVIYDNADYRLQRWRHLVDSARSRDLQSGLFQIIDEVLRRLATAGRLDDEDAFEYLANAREAWSMEDGEDASDGEEEGGDSSFGALLEKLDATVFGLVEALDSDAADLSRLLDEALTGSLWARRIARSTEDLAEGHKAILNARARLIWAHTTPQLRRGHFAMGVGLDSGLAIDAMAEDLASLIDEADEAAVSGDAEKLGDALAGAAGRLLQIRPFAPDDGLVPGWEKTLRDWVSGVGVDVIGPAKMKLVEDAFTYRLVWGLEAIRTRRIAAGWQPELLAGGGAAASETGVPNIMMAMLVRAGLPSRKAAIAAIGSTQPGFADSAGLRQWLMSDEVEARSAQDDWPTAETAALWRRFRNEVTGASAPTWRTRNYARALDLKRGQSRPPNGDYRVELDPATNRAWIVSADFRRLVPLRRTLRDNQHAHYRARFVDGDHRAQVELLGPGQPEWDVS